ncbi:DUF1036 domain-containing protein [Lutibaculum baratangense]|uniref:DUF1036 domain-containing protein n=1 Tax=Lutibaculum baratangense TaxID=1358440 RepID=UPI000687E5A0|nr:DUF1036 domain-containing protein [Lutibaculum baratangense]
MTENNVRSQCCGRLAALAVPAFVFSLAYLGPTKAEADFRICNTTPSRVGIAIGYKDAKGWATEGWWNVEANACETLLQGSLAARYYYLYAIDYDQGGEWSGAAFMCTQDQMFTIRGIDRCEDRGYFQTGFFEIDTLEQSSWTVQLTDPAIEASAAR